jgi:hypothetical protein
MVNRLLSTLDEKHARRVAGMLALQRGHGGIAELITITGMSRNTIVKGQEELAEREDPVAADRVRAPGGGRPPLEKKLPN